MSNLLFHQGMLFHNWKHVEWDEKYNGMVKPLPILLGKASASTLGDAK
jgi:hypothetical protein